ncbi:hypothetical protein BD779DRAFT_1445242 [Infundibulicybe gibba]|nr:hypothetical protein BD779DRAFT_1445242 [Infundibulicybe gibba]
MPLIFSASPFYPQRICVLIAIAGNETKYFHNNNIDKEPNETLAYHGYIGATPTSPTIAFSFQLLEAYRQLHRTSPRLVFEAYMKALCHLHQIPFRKYIAEQLRMAFDTYLEILHQVDIRVATAMKRDDNWRKKNACAPCLYKVRDEPALKFSLLAAMDGNSSLKLVDSAFRPGARRADDRTQRCNFWATPEEVDLFKDEGKKEPPAEPSQAVPGPSTQTQQDIQWEAPANNDTNQSIEVCLERWRNAGPEARKRMFALFAVAGIFLVVCRHGHLLFICDMIRSGELMKYPLALVKKMLNNYGDDIALAYDIACAFHKTLERSSLGPAAQHHRLRGIVPAFHGHAHNRGCQVEWHPMYIEGVGLEDFEECERTFSKSNALATGTRLATSFHRHQLIEEHFLFHSEDKYAESGNFIYNNYRQAQEIIRADGARLMTLSKELKTGPNDYERYLASEREYLERLKREPPEAKRNHEMLDYAIIQQGATSKEINNINTRRRTTQNRWNTINEEALQFEESHDIVDRWTPQSREYQDALTVMAERKYRKALDNLERLMVQRLFELSKLGLSGVGYKQREKIGQALRTRSEAIKHARDEYNTYAALLHPPRPELSWAQLVEITTLGEFDLLRDARQDIRQLEWARPVNREAMQLYFRIKRANEEIERLNVEITRLLTFMLDEHTDFFYAIADNMIRNPTLAYELQQRWLYSQKVNEGIVSKLLQASRLRSFTGCLQPSSHINRDADHNQDIPLPPWAEGFAWNDTPTHENENEAEDDDTVDSLIQYFENL